ncbi:hypothetical protein D3C76_1713340 [compost metagenome]
MTIMINTLMTVVIVYILSWNTLKFMSGAEEVNCRRQNRIRNSPPTIKQDNTSALPQP